MGGSDSRNGPRLLPELTGGALPTAPDRPNVEKNRVRAQALQGLFGDGPESVRIGRYEILGRLGAGAMGVVYEARDSQLERVVALKVLSPSFSSQQSESLNERMLREARAMAKLSHPNVATVFDVGVHDGQVFLAMEYLSGGTLRAWLEAAPHSWSEVLGVLRAAGYGLAAAHSHGLIHRDFKPDNVLIDSAGNPKIVDFGLVRNIDITGQDVESESPGAIQQVERLTRTGALLGTPAYMPPEQLRGEKIDARCDQFAFCASLFEALNGRRPFEGADIDELMTAVESGTVSEMSPHVPEPLRGALVKGLSAYPHDRFPSMDDLLVAIEPGQTAALVPPASTLQPRRMVPIIASLAVLVVVGAVTAFALLLWSLSSSNRPDGRYVQAIGALDFGHHSAEQSMSKTSDNDAAPVGQGSSRTSKIQLSEADADLLRRVKTLEAAGQYRECLDLGESVPGNIFLYGYRTTCALYLQDWDAYNRACRDWEQHEPEFYDADLCSPSAIALHKHTNRSEWRECLTVAEAGPPSMRNLAYRITCSSMVGDWDANRRACERLAEISPNHTALATCRMYAKRSGFTKR